MTEPKQKVLYDMLEGLLKSQEESVAAVRQSEKEVKYTFMINPIHMYTKYVLYGF